MATEQSNIPALQPDEIVANRAQSLNASIERRSRWIGMGYSLIAGVTAGMVIGSAVTSAEGGGIRSEVMPALFFGAVDVLVGSAVLRGELKSANQRRESAALTGALATRMLSGAEMSPAAISLLSGGVPVRLGSAEAQPIPAAAAETPVQ